MSSFRQRGHEHGDCLAGPAAPHQACSTHLARHSGAANGFAQ
jgi:hypothetical protein